MNHMPEHALIYLPFTAQSQTLPNRCLMHREGSGTDAASGPSNPNPLDTKWSIRNRTALPDRISFLLLRHPTVLTDLTVTSRKTAMAWRPSSKHAVQNLAPDHKGIASTPLILTDRILRTTVMMCPIGGAHQAFSPSQECANAFAPVAPEQYSLA